MKSLFINLVCSILLVTMGASCTEKDTPVVEKTLFLRNKGADMPIWVRGNVASNKMVLFMHGGPGDCAMCYRYYLKGLEKNVAVAYWDQRIAGSSSGKVDPKTLNYEQLGEDAYYAVKLLKEQFPQTQIYLLAHSYGVELAWQFLTTNSNQQLVSGLMIVNGTFSNYRWLFQVREWVLREAKRQQKADIEQYAQTHTITPETLKGFDWQTMYRKMLDLGGNPLSLYSNKKFVLNYVFSSPNTPLAQFTHGSAYQSYFDTEMLNFDKSASLKSINIPVGLFWGTKDGVVPVEVGYETRDLLVNAPKTLVTFEQSWHEPFVSETDKFVREVIRFVNP